MGMSYVQYLTELAKTEDGVFYIMQLLERAYEGKDVATLNHIKFNSFVASEIDEEVKISIATKASEYISKIEKEKNETKKEGLVWSVKA
jgi:hypothetical protein